jgi:cytochrome b561
LAEARNGYTRLQIGIHWLVVAMVAVQLVIAGNMTEMVDAIEEGESVSSSEMLWGNVHYWLGLAILAAMLVRLGVRIVSGAPAHAGPALPVTDMAAAAMHWALYLVLLAAPVSGLVAYYGIADVGDLHGLSRQILIVLVALHVLAALYNQYVRKDGTLTRILRAR